MQSNEEKLRSAVYTVLEGCTLNHDVRKILEAAYYAPEALALPTAVPVGDLADLPRYTAWSHLKTHGSWPEGIDRSWMKDEMGRYNDVTVSNAVIAELRAALSAGDAVDAQRLDFIEKSARCDPKMDGQHVWWPTSLNKALKGPTLRDAIDAAMRKGQL